MTGSSSYLGEIADAAAELAQLREAADGVLKQTWSVERTLKLLDSAGPAYDDELWDTVNRLGWGDVLVEESADGGGGTLSQLCVLSEAVGAATAPVPLAAAGGARWCEQRCAGDLTLVLDGPAIATVDGVSGIWPAIPFGAIAARFLVLAHRDGVPMLLSVDAAGDLVERVSIRPLDHNPAARITLDNTPFHVVAQGPAAAHRHRGAVSRTLLASVAELVGVASAANQAAVDYAKVRVAFGRPIGGFQAVKHRLVDQRTAIEVGRALVNRAADAIEHGEPDATASVSLAVFWAIDSLRAIPEGAAQVFGGIGYTWEHEAHVYLRRAASVVAGLGPRGRHRAVVTDWLTRRHAAQR